MINPEHMTVGLWLILAISMAAPVITITYVVVVITQRQQQRQRQRQRQARRDASMRRQQQWCLNQIKQNKK